MGGHNTSVDHMRGMNPPKRKLLSREESVKMGKYLKMSESAAPSSSTEVSSVETRGTWVFSIHLWTISDTWIRPYGNYCLRRRQ